MRTSLGLSLGRHLHCTTISSRHKAESIAELGNMCGLSTLTCPYPSKVKIPISSHAFQDPLHRSVGSNAFQDHPHSPINCQLFQDHHPPKSLIPRHAKGKPSFARPSLLSPPPLSHHLGKFPSCIPHPPGVNKAITVFPSKEDLLLHMSTLVLLPSVCANKKTQTPEEPCSAPTIPSTPREELEAESLDSLDSQTSTVSNSLHPRLPITYNEAALSWLQGRPQVITCNNLSYPSPAIVSAVQMTPMAALHPMEQTTLMAPPAEVEADLS